MPEFEIKQGTIFSTASQKNCVALESPSMYGVFFGRDDEGQSASFDLGEVTSVSNRTKPTQAEVKRVAREEIMRAIASLVDNWKIDPPDELYPYATTGAEERHYEWVLKAEANRVAKLLGSDQRWEQK